MRLTEFANDACVDCSETSMVDGYSTITMNMVCILMNFSIHASKGLGPVDDGAKLQAKEKGEEPVELMDRI